MKFQFKTFFLLLCSSPAFHGIHYVSAVNESSKRASTKSFGRRLLQEPCVLMLKKIVHTDTSEAEEVECMIPSNGNFVRILGPNDASTVEKDLLVLFRTGEIISAHTTLMKVGANFDEEGNLILENLSDVQFGGEGGTGGSRRKLAVIGNKTFLAIRVIANDASTTSSSSEISDAWYGTNGDRVNFKSQYEACSFNQFKVEPFNSGNVTDGVHTVTIARNVVGVSNSIVRNAVATEATNNLGDLESTFDHVMLCLPPGTSGGWIAYAYVNHWLSVYNDKWCDYVSGQMHEIGHNIGLAHSGETATYDDQSGMMGYSYGDSDAPEMCFNAAKGWQLGWYSERQETITTSWSGQLFGIANYNNTQDNDRVILQIPGESLDWYVSFNHADGINKGTVEGGNQVLVHRRPKGEGYGESDLMKKMGEGEDYSGAPLGIKVNSIDTTASSGFASVTIYSKTSPPTPAPVITTAPTSRPSPSPTKSPTPIPTHAPTPFPTSVPTKAPTKAPTQPPTPPSTGECTVEKFSSDVGGIDKLAELLQITDNDAMQAELSKRCREALYPKRDLSIATGKGPQFLKNFLDGGTTWNDHKEYVDEDGVTKYSLEVDAAIIKSEYEAYTKTTVYSAPNGGAEDEYPGYFSNFYNDNQECRMGAMMCCYTDNREGDFVGNADICAHDMALSAKSNHVKAKSFTVFDTSAPNQAYCTGFAWEEGSFADAVKYNTLFHMAMKENLYDKGYVQNIPGAPMCGCVEQMPIVDNAGCVKAKEGYKIDTTTGKISVDISFEGCNDLSAYYKSLEGRGDTEKFFMDARIVTSGTCDAAAFDFMNERMLVHY